MSSVSTDGGYQNISRSMSDLENEMRNETRRARERYEERADLIEKKSNENIRKIEKSSENEVQRYRDGTDERIEKEREEARADVEKARSQNYDKFGRTQAESASQQKRAEEAIQHNLEDIDHQKTKLDGAMDRATEKAFEAAQAREAKNIQAEKDSRYRENTALRRTINQMAGNQGAYNREKAQGRVDAFREYENENNARLKTQATQYEDEIHQLDRKAIEADRNYAQMEDRNRRAQDMQFARTLQGVNQQHQDEVKYLAQNTEHEINQIRDMADKEGRHTNDAMDRQATLLAEQGQRALTEQAETFRHELATQAEDDQSKINRLQDQITNHIASGDQNWVSPSAEAKMRDNFLREYDKKLQSQVTRDKSKTDSLQKEYSGRLAENIAASDRRITQNEQQHSIENHQRQATYQDHVNELTRNYEEAILDREYQTSRQADAMNHSFSDNLERQRKDYEATINQLRTDAAEKLTAVRQQADFDAKLAQRNFASQQYEAAKVHERKMEEQKNFYEDTIANLKEQLAHQGHEAERRARQALDEQAKQYEQKIAQMEYQTKERERTISDNYTDQIEKLKRSNALLIQRKS